MTITEHLEFSVLTAPVASYDRRALSQAWYSALYGAHRPAGAVEKTLPQPCNRPAAVDALVRNAAMPEHREQRRPAQSGVTGTKPNAAGFEAERRAPRSSLARKIERAFIRTRQPQRKAAFTIDGVHGRVQVLLRTHGSRFKLVAICSPKARTQVAAALAQARYALAARGITLEAHARDGAAC
jgi:hypothetical protein